MPIKGRLAQIEMLALPLRPAPPEIYSKNADNNNNILPPNQKHRFRKLVNAATETHAICVVPVHYGSIPIRFAPLLPFSKWHIWKITFTFDMYLGTSSKEATAAKEPLEISTGWWNDVLQIFGTRWMLCQCFPESLGSFLPVPKTSDGFIQNWAKSGPLLFVISEILNAMNRPIVQWIHNCKHMHMPFFLRYEQTNNSSKSQKENLNISIEIYHLTRITSRTVLGKFWNSGQTSKTFHRSQSIFFFLRRILCT